MLTVTDRAREHLKSAVLPRTGTSRLSARLTATGPGELGLVPDVPKDDDQVVEHDGAIVLLVDRVYHRLRGVGSGRPADAPATRQQLSGGPPDRRRRADKPRRPWGPAPAGARGPIRRRGARCQRTRPDAS